MTLTIRLPSELALRPPQLIDLPGGTLSVSVHEQRSPHFGLDQLCDFAARNNPRRGFLVVSRLLGRHIPSPPAAMDRLHQLMAAQLADAGALPGPVVFLAMAETATCLGQAVHDAFRMQTGRDDTLCLHSTRQLLPAPAQADGPPTIIAEFSEPHSHAARHLVYEPIAADLQARLRQARSLVLIDDETSTGTTFINAAAALRPVMPHLTTVTSSVITDWSDSSWRQQLGCAGEAHAVLRGTLAWTPRADFVSPAAPVANTGALGTLCNHQDYGRRGTPSDRHILPIGTSYDDLAAHVAHSAPAPRYLILGTGEFTYPAYLLALALDRRGHETVMQATTRSPVHVGGAIAAALRFADNYATGVPNFLYNAPSERQGKVIICAETGAGSVDPALVAALDADVLHFGAAMPEPQP